MRQDIFSRGPIFGAGSVIGTPLRRARIRSTTTVTRPAAARPIVKATNNQPTSMCGNRVVTISVPERTSSMPTMIPATPLSQPGLTHGPSTSGSLQRSSKKTLADGSRSPARAWTVVVIRPSGAPGMRTIPAATADHADIAHVELPASLKLRCREWRIPNTSPKA